MKHQRGWASIAKEVETWIKKTYPKSSYTWVKTIEHLRGDEYGGGRIRIVAEGYRTGEKTVWTRVIHGKKIWSI